MEYLSNLADQLNHPDIPWKTIIVGFSLSQYLLETGLQLRQHKVLQGDKIPAALSEDVTKETFDKSQAYGRAKSNFGFFKEFYGILQVLAIIYFDLLVRFWDMSADLLPYLPAAFKGEKTQSVIFFMIFNFVSTALNLPTSYWHTFVLEEKFGFNKQTKGLFFTDLVKSQVLTAVIGIPCIAAFLKIIEATGDKFFYYLFIFVVALQAFMITVYPIFILPLFNKLSPLEEGELKTSTEALAKRLEFPLKSLFVIDGSKRSAHSNAYFYGLPWSKHIVIYDTLLEKSSVPEVVAVLAHELGHWSLSHTTKLLVIGQAHMFAIFTLFSIFIHNDSLYEAFGFTKVHPILVGLILFNDLLQPIDTFLKLGMNILSRKFEFEADAFAVKLGYAADLAQSLINLQVENLSTMDSDWMYAAYHFSHPILPERLRALGWKPKKATK